MDNLAIAGVPADCLLNRRHSPGNSPPFYCRSPMLWLAIRVPCLALEIHSRAYPESLPLALAEHAGANATVLLCNAAAHDCGVRPGMSIASASALRGNLCVVSRDLTAERCAVERIAASLLSFTPQVSLAGPAELVLEIGASLALFRGIGRLRRAIAGNLGKLGYSFRMACAPTPQAALWFARAGITACITRADELPTSLKGVPVTVLDSPEPAAALQRFGINSIGDCAALPRAGLARRLGQHLLDEIDRALGLLPDPRPPYALPDHFDSRLPLPAPTTQTGILLIAGKRLCIELCSYLSASSQGAQQLHWTLHHERRNTTRLVMDLASISRDADHLLVLLRERLASTTLEHPVIALGLACTRRQPLSSATRALLQEQVSQSAAADRLLDRLRARLGPAAIKGLEQQMDHRPEHAWRVCSPGTGRKTPAAMSNGVRRPLWLLEKPGMLQERQSVPWHEGPLTLIAGPERIECGWWDRQPAIRDYFIARDARNAVLWIYRERIPGGRWFLHGYFS